MISSGKILIIGAGTLQVPAIIRAKEMGLLVVALDMDPNAPGFRFADECIQISTTDIENAVEAALKIKPHAVMTLASDRPVRTVAAINQALGLTTISMETAFDATDKGRMREKLRKHGVPVPDFFIVDNLEDFMKASLKFSGKFIVKPVDNSGSRGVFLANGTDSPEAIFNYSSKHSHSGKVILEEYMTGPEVSVETMTLDHKTEVVAITDKLTTGAPFFVEMGHVIPSSLSEPVQHAIKQAARSAAQAIGIENGPSHVEIIVTDEGPKIVEIGARLGGDNITTRLVPLATGVDMVECSIRAAFGDATDIHHRWSMGAAIRYFHAPAGTFKSVDHVREAALIKGVQEIVFTKKPGESIFHVQSSTDRIGYVIAQAKTPSEAVDICEKVLKCVRIHTG